MKQEFIGRADELMALTERNWRKKALLAVVYGRRRVGKTALVEHAFKDECLWKFEGLENGTTKTQLSLFSKELGNYTGKDVSPGIDSWDNAFKLLDQALESGRMKAGGRPIVIFFDEFQWMCEMKTKLVALFKYHWDNHLSRHENAVFVLCGSVSSFIVKKVIQSRALYGRVDIELCVPPLSIREARLLMPESMPPSQCIETYMTFGGIPQYLIELNPKLSLDQNINEYGFKPTGYFFREFDRLFISHFASNPLYEKILRAVVSGVKSPSGIAKSCSVGAGGSLGEKINDLVLAGFLSKRTPVDKDMNSRLIQYELADEYLHFYFSFIAPHSADIVSGNALYPQVADSRSLQQWRGYAFERLCIKNAAAIAARLRFAGIRYRSGPWFKRSQDSRGGAQIDLLFVRADKVLTLCEMKYAGKLSAKSLESALDSKKSVLAQAFPGYSIETVLITGKTALGLESAGRTFDHCFTAEDLFL